MTDQIFADLHLHTYYSDGWATPSEVVKQAKSTGLSVIAITDHDNMRGSLEAQDAANAAGIELIPAVELTTFWEDDGWNSHVDLMAYFVDVDDLSFSKMLDDALNDSYDRVAQCCDRLRFAGYDITFDDVRQQNPRYPGIAPLIRVLMRRGYVENFYDGVKVFYTVWPEVPRCKLDIDTAIELVHRAGGVTVLAHPPRIPRNGGSLQADHLIPLVEAGLDGIEVCHPSIDNEAAAYYSQMAAELGLLPSGGSDEHEINYEYNRMGKYAISREQLDLLRNRAQFWRSQPGRNGAKSSIND